MEVSKTGEGDLLIHKPDGNGGFINIIIDPDDCSIEILHITGDRKNSWHKNNATVDETIDFWNNKKNCIMII